MYFAKKEEEFVEDHGHLNETRLVCMFCHMILKIYFQACIRGQPEDVADVVHLNQKLIAKPPFPQPLVWRGEGAKAVEN